MTTALACLLLIAVLGATDEPSQTDRLIQQLGSPSFQEREAATERLAAMGGVAFEALYQAASHSSDPEVRYRARDLFNRIEGQLIDGLDDSSTSRSAADALRKAGRSALPTLLEAFKPRASCGRVEVATLLGDLALEEPQARQALLKALESALDNNPVRVRCAQALSQLARNDQVVLSAFLRMLAEDKDAEIRVAVAEAFRRMKEKPQAAIPPLLKALKDTDSRVRASVAASVAQAVDGRTAAPAILDAFKGFRDAASFELMARALGRTGPQAAPLLIEALSNEDRMVRAGAVAALGHVKPAVKEAIPAISKLLKDEDAAVCSEAALALSHMVPLKDRNLKGSHGLPVEVLERGAEADLLSGPVLDVEPRATLLGRGGSFMSVAFAPDGKTLAAACTDRKVWVWEPITARVIAVLQGHDNFANAVAFSPDGKWLASGDSDGIVKLWDARAWKENMTLRGHADSVRTLAFSLDSEVLASGAQDGTVRLWGVKSRKEIAVLRRKNREGRFDITVVTFSPNGKLLAAGDNSGACIWDFVGQKELADLVPDIAVRGLSFSPDGTLLAEGGGKHGPKDQQLLRPENVIGLWRVREQKEAVYIGDHPGGVLGLAFSPDGQLLVSAESDGSVRLWSATGRRLATLRHHRSVYSVCFSPDGRLLASASSDGTVKVWDVQRLLAQPCP